MPASVSHPIALATIELRVPGSDRRGRAFVPVSLLQAFQLDDLAVELGRRFADEEDENRLPLLERALAGSAVTVETYPDETDPAELHAYVRAPHVSDAPIFACVIVSTRVVQGIVTKPPHVVLETATLQVIEDEASPASIAAGLEAWARRVWPSAEVPRVRLHQWPDTEDTDAEAGGFLRKWPKMRLPTAPVRGARPLLRSSDVPAAAGQPP